MTIKGPRERIGPVDVKGQAVVEATAPGALPAPSSADRSFGDRLLHENEEHFLEAWRTPFVQGLLAGDLSSGQIRFYLEQQKIYNIEVARCSARAVVTVRDPARMLEIATEVVADLGAPKRSLISLYEVIGLADADLIPGEPGGTARRYVDHLMSAAVESGEMYEAASLPCALMYGWLGRRGLACSQSREIAFSPWWHYYGDPGRRATERWRLDRLSTYAEQASDAERRALRETFALSCRFEVEYWDMCWHGDIEKRNGESSSVPENRQYFRER